MTGRFPLAAMAIVIGASMGSLPAAAQDKPFALALSCAACHGTDGKSPGSIPTIGGRSAKEIKESLIAFKSGTRPSTVMKRLAEGYTDQDIDALAAYFSKRK
ncbi:MAG: cytochrome c [Alphaproteobacteria bacterium]|nr:cytochrome c [Alphaproteobacteria bacterium]